MRHAELVDTLTSRLAEEPALEALFLGGSFGAGRADDYSDVDFLAIAAAEDHPRIAELWRQSLEAAEPVVFWNERRGGGILLNAITEDWLRVDLFVAEPGHLARFAKAGLKPLVDRAGLYDTLPDTLPPARPDPRKIAYLANEFIRVLGLIPVGLGRGELVMGVKGADILRDLLVDLMLEECPIPDRGGVLHLSRLLPANDMAVLLALPYSRPEREALIAAHAALAVAFLPRAKRLAAGLGVEWPADFEAATRRHLEATLGLAI